MSEVNNRYYTSKINNRCYMSMGPLGKKLPLPGNNSKYYNYYNMHDMHKSAALLSDGSAIATLLEYNNPRASNENERNIIVVDNHLDQDDFNTIADSSIYVACAAKYIADDSSVLVVSDDILNKSFALGFELDGINVVADLRKKHELVSYISYDDFIIVNETGNKKLMENAASNVIYSGELPYAIAHVAGISVLHEELLHSYFTVLGAEDRFDVPEEFDILAEMSFGRNSLEDGDLDWTCTINDPYAAIVNDGVVDGSLVDYSSEVFTQINNRASLVRDLTTIWASEQERAGIGVRMPSRILNQLYSPGNLSRQANESNATTPEKLAHAMRRISDELGIRGSVDAYYAGVQVSNIII